MSSPSSTLLRLSGLTTVPRGDFALRDISFSLSRGEILGLIGPNGSGKTTLLQAILGYLPLASGAVFLEDRPLPLIPPGDRSRLLAWVPQQEDPSPPFTVREWVEMARYARHGPLSALSPADHEAVARALDQCELRSLAGRLGSTLSGGEWQRVLLARALAQETPILLLDEPTTHLDLGGQTLFLQLLARLARERHTALLLVLHDLNAAARLCHRLLLFHRGRLLHDAPPPEILRPAFLEPVFGVPLQTLPGPEPGLSTLAVRPSPETPALNPKP